MRERHAHRNVARHVIFITGPDRARLYSHIKRTAPWSVWKRTGLGLGPTVRSAPEFDGLCSHQPKRSAPAIFLVWSGPNKAGVNTPLVTE